MSFDPLRHHRRSIRLPGYDYAQAGAYFVTIVTWQRECPLCEIRMGQVILSPVGQVVHREWDRLRSRFPGVGLDEFAIMPNHIHGIVVIHDRCRGAAGFYEDHDPERVPLRPYRNSIANVIPGSLGAVVRAFKSSTTYRYHRMRFSSGSPLWQRNYHEHIIRDEAEWERICQYIRENPAQWENDRENPDQYPV